MKILCSPDGFLDPLRPVQGISDLRSAGFSAMSLDLNLFCGSYELEHLGKPPQNNQKPVRPLVSEHPTLLREYAQQVITVCAEKLDIPLARVPKLLRDTKRTDLNYLLEKLAAESIRICGSIGCGSIVIRPLFAGLTPSELWEVNREYYLRLAEIARECDVTILLENQAKDFSGHLIRGICSDPTEAARWVDALNTAVGEKRFGFCMDVGVCRICGYDMGSYATTLGERLEAIVLRECDGYHEQSLMPFTIADRMHSQKAWIDLIRGLREISFNGLLLISAGDTFSAFSPLLRPQVLSLAHSVAEYFRWQIELENTLKRYPSVVLFGAGNMCRNYMKCYGEKYPPLFACSNSERQWGTKFCGLEVRPPEALREIPADCAILICNVYYREIEQQLREMGLPNKIDYFNDEYMPSFYFDRVQRG